MSKDVKLLLLAAVGLGFFAWGLAYSGAFGNLVNAGTSGYGNVVHALEPPASALQQASQISYNPNYGTGTSIGSVT